MEVVVAVQDGASGCIFDDVMAGVVDRSITIRSGGGSIVGNDGVKQFDVAGMQAGNPSACVCSIVDYG